MKKLTFIVGLMICLAAWATPRAAASQQTIAMGRATDKVKKGYERLQPIVTFLASRLAHVGISKGQVVLDGKNNNQKIIDYLNSGKLDIVLDSPFPTAVYMKTCGAKPILMASREGMLTYRTNIFVRKDTKIRTIADLKGQTIAFEDPTSTSSYYLPKRAIERMALELKPADGKSPVPKNNVGYVFAGSELNISGWVYYGKVAAGALSEADWVDQTDNPETYRKQFRIIHQTEAIPRMVVLVRKDLPPRILSAVRNVLLAMHETEAGREALKNYKFDYFLEIPPDAVELLNALTHEIP